MYARLTNLAAQKLFVIVAFRCPSRLIVHSESTQTVPGFVTRLTKMVVNRGHLFVALVVFGSKLNSIPVIKSYNYGQLLNL